MRRPFTGKALLCLGEPLSDLAKRELPWLWTPFGEATILIRIAGESWTGAERQTGTERNAQLGLVHFIPDSR